MTVLNLQVGTSADDAYEHVSGGIISLSHFRLFFGNWGATRHIGLRFTGISGLSGATIDSAVLNFPNAYYSDSGNFVGDWYADDREDPPAFTSAAYDISSRTRTTATCEGDGGDFGYWTVGDKGGDGWDFAGPAPGIKGIIQELADDYDPAEIALLHIYVSGSGERVAHSYDYTSTDGAKLSITFTPAGPAPITGQASLTGVGALAAAAGLTIPGSVALSGLGFLVAAGTIGVIREGAAVLSGVGSLTPGTPVLTLVGQASILGEGSLVAVGERGVLGAVALAGIGSISAIGEIGGTLEGRAVLAGVGSLAAVGQRIVPGQVSMAGTGSLIPTGVVVVVGAAAFAGAGSLTVIGTVGLYTQMGRRTFDIDVADYPPDTLFYLEANMESDVAGNDSIVRLFNLTDAAEVSGSPITILGPGPAWGRSGSFSLPGPGVKRYRVEYGGTAGGIYTPHGAALRIVSS